MAPIIGQPFGRGPPLPFGFGSLKQIPVIFGVAARELFALTTLDEFLERVGPRRVEQSEARLGVAHIRSDQRLHDKFRHPVDNFAFGGALHLQ